MAFPPFKERLIAAFDVYFAHALNTLPAVAGGLVVLALGYGLAKLLQWITRRVIRSTGLEGVAERNGLERVLKRLGGTAFVAGRIMYWITFIFFVLAAAEVMDIALITDALRRFFGYIPRLLTALAVLVAGIWLGQKVRGVANGLSGSMGLAGGKVVGQIIFGIIVVFMGITALNVAGIDTTLITSNILLFLGGVLLAFSVAYGMASKDILTSILGSYYGKDRFEPGQVVRIGNDTGVIERIDSVSMTIRTVDRIILIPASKLITERIEVLDHDADRPIERPLTDHNTQNQETTWTSR
ncbi:MAG: mechanosensitive ion channel [Flavobacteriales bacterium]